MTYRKRKLEIIRKFLNPDLVIDARRVFSKDIKNDKETLESSIRLGQKLKELFEDLGPVFIKFGQVLSTRRDIFPEAMIKELEKLQDDVKEEDLIYIKDTIEKEFGRAVEDIFLDFDEKALAAGSIAQTHLAYINYQGSIRKVVVKVRREGVEDKVSEDLKIMTDLYKRFKNKLSFIQSFDLGDVIEEFKLSLTKEIDLELEKENILKYRADNKMPSDFRAPLVFEPYCGKTVLTIEYIEGKSIREAYAMDSDTRKILAQRIIKAYSNQMFSYGFFHADPHPGNIFINEKNDLYLIDFGIVSSLSKNYRYQIIKIFLGASLNEVRLITDAIIGMGLLAFDSKKIPIFERRIQKLLDKYMAMNISQLKLVELIADFYRLLVDYSIKIPSELANFAKTILTVEGLIEKLVPEQSFLELAIPLSKAMALKLLSPDLVTDRLLKNTYDSFSLIKELPETSLNILRQLVRGDFAIVEKKSEEEFQAYQKIEKNKTRALASLGLSLIISSLTISLVLLGIRNKLFVGLLSGSLLMTLVIFLILLIKILKKDK
ncbi:AarF/ABC1/UbiB kinase family protein [Anaerococcus tetradius]|uniref:ABC1 kinase family protein n=1 Tax=Anaerococcus tetradius TaxID=33036 RepID=UPI0023F0853E|nr:AarF/UbiB family protein [Anaerococcus tetradius]